MTANALGLNHLKIRSLNVNYDGSQGTVDASVFDVATGSTAIEASDYHLEVSKLDGNMYFEKSDTRITLSDIEESLFGSLGVLQVGNLNLEYISSGQLMLNFDSVGVESGDGIHSIGKVDLKCKSSATRNGDIFSFLTPCTEYGVLYIPEFVFSNESKKSIESAFQVNEFQKAFFEDGHDVSVKGILPDRIKNLLINVKDNKFTLKGKVKVLFNLKLKGNGTIRFHEQGSELEIHLSKVKVGFIGITGTIIKKIKEAKLKNTRVVGNSIFIKI